MSKNLKYELEIFKEQTILVTGGAGAIGCNLSRKLPVAGTKKVIIEFKMLDTLA